MIQKKDWQEVLRLIEVQKVQASIALEQDEVLIELCKKKIAEFPDDDPMPEDLKEDLKEVVK